MVTVKSVTSHPRSLKCASIRSSASSSLILCTRASQRAAERIQETGFGQRFAPNDGIKLRVAV
jgi:hypothetical protein